MNLLSLNPIAQAFGVSQIVDFHHQAIHNAGHPKKGTTKIIV